MKRPSVSNLLVLGAALASMLPSQALAGLEWTIGEKVALPASVRSVTEAPGGARLYVLTAEGSILVLDRNRQVEATIAGPFVADQILASADGSQLYLAGTGQPSLQVVALAERAAINVGKSPVKGDPQAPVAVYVFSDFQ